MSIKLYDAEIEYLESSGTQYIQLACNVSAGTYFAVGGVVIPIYTSTQQDYTVFGANPHVQFNSAFYSKNNTTNKITYTSIIGELGAAGGVGGGWGGEIGTEVSFELSTTEKVVNGVHTSISRPLKAAITAFRIFGGYQNTNRYPIRIKSFYIKKGNDTLYDLIPVRIGQVGYMYDRVSGQLFGNSGTGSFVLGPDVAPGRYANEIAFLESTGSQYIDTGYVDNTNANKTTFMFGVKGDGDIIGNKVHGSTTYANGTKIIGANATGAFAYYKPTGDRVLLQTENGDEQIQNITTTYNKSNSTFELYVDGDTITGVYSGIDSQTPYTLLIRDAAMTVGWFVGKIYYAKIYEDDVLIHDFIPVEYNNIGYLYDKVSGQFFANQGTGKFVLGHRAPRFDGKACARSYTRRQLMMEIGKPYDAEIEYLQSNAASGFNIVTNNEFPVQCTFELKYKLDNLLGIYEYQTYFHRETTPFRTPSVYMAGRSSGYYYQTSDTSGNPKNLLRQNMRDTNTHTLVVNFENRTVTLDGTQSNFANSFTMYTVPSKMCLFSAVDSSRKGLYGKIYYFKISKNNQVLLDLIPVRKGNVGMMYDKVTGAVYKNTSTGTFIVGPDI